MDEVPSQPPPRSAGTAPTPPLRSFLRKKRRTSVGDLIIPLVALGLAFTLFYMLSQRRLVANIMALNDTDKPLTLQVNLEKVRVEPGGAGTMQVYHVSGEAMDVLSGGGVVETVSLPDQTPAWVIYNMKGKSSAVVVDYSWAYGVDGKRNTSGPPFKVVANLRAQKLFTFGDAVVLGPDDPLPTTYQEGKPLLKVERVPELQLKEPDQYLREKMKS